MAGDVNKAVLDAFKQAGIATDIAPEMYGIALKAIMRRMGEKWQKKFDDASEEWATTMARQQFRQFSKAFQANLINAGWAIEYKPSQRGWDAFNESVASNVKLIRSIPEQYLDQVKANVIKMVESGFDLGSLTESILANKDKDNLIYKRDTLAMREKVLNPAYKTAFNRAAFVARDQSFKVKSSIERAEWIEMGFTHAIWHHAISDDRYDFRPLHKAAGEMKYIYKISEGAPVGEDNAYVQIGEEYNCKCSSRAILPALHQKPIPPQPTIAQLNAKSASLDKKESAKKLTLGEIKIAYKP